MDTRTFTNEVHIGFNEKGTLGVDEELDEKEVDLENVKFGIVSIQRIYDEIECAIDIDTNEFWFPKSYNLSNDFRPSVDNQDELFQIKIFGDSINRCHVFIDEEDFYNYDVQEYIDYMLQMAECDKNGFIRSFLFPRWFYALWFYSLG